MTFVSEIERAKSDAYFLFGQHCTWWSQIVRAQIDWFRYASFANTICAGTPTSAHTCTRMRPPTRTHRDHGEVSDVQTQMLCARTHAWYRIMNRQNHGPARAQANGTSPHGRAFPNPSCPRCPSDSRACACAVRLCVPHQSVRIVRSKESCAIDRGSRVDSSSPVGKKQSSQ